jgi:hypothetical protein
MALVTIESKRGTKLAIQGSRITMVMRGERRIHLYLTNGVVVNFEAGELLYTWLLDMLDKKSNEPLDIQTDSDVVIRQPEMELLRV